MPPATSRAPTSIPRSRWPSRSPATFPLREALAYIAAQCAGAIAAALALLAVWPDQPAQLGATLPTVGIGSALAYEVVLSAFLMFVIMAVATDTRAVGAAAAIAIGGTVGLDALVGGPVTGASMNPARSLGPAIAAWEWRDFWIYLVGPIGGAALGGLAYQLVRGEQAGARPDATKLPLTAKRAKGGFVRS